MRRTYTEREQPESRKSLGPLEKHKDYVERAKLNERNRKILKDTYIKALKSNKDEFYFGMHNSRLENGCVVKAPRLATHKRLEELNARIRAINYYIEGCGAKKQEQNNTRIVFSERAKDEGVAGSVSRVSAVDRDNLIHSSSSENDPVQSDSCENDSVYSSSGGNDEEDSELDSDSCSLHEKEPSDLEEANSFMSSQSLNSYESLTDEEIGEMDSVGEETVENFSLDAATIQRLKEELERCLKERESVRLSLIRHVPKGRLL